jgi:hypothetical protein
MSDRKVDFSMGGHAYFTDAGGDKAVAFISSDGKTVAMRVHDVDHAYADLTVKQAKAIRRQLTQAIRVAQAE